MNSHIWHPNYVHETNSLSRDNLPLTIIQKDLERPLGIQPSLQIVLQNHKPSPKKYEKK
jgi:hypothetical protein